VCIASNWSSTDQSLVRIAGCLECNSSDCSYTVPDDEFNELETCRTLNINIMLY
jgi:hypothetical protein